MKLRGGIEIIHPWIVGDEIIGDHEPVQLSNILIYCKHTLILREICHNTRVGQMHSPIAKAFTHRWLSLSNTEKYTLCHSCVPGGMEWKVLG